MPQKDIVDLLTDDHAEIRTLFGQLDETPADQRGDLFHHRHRACSP